MSGQTSLSVVESPKTDARIIGMLTQLASSNGVTTKQLQRALPPRRVGDPLGLGIRPEDRPAPPQDPDVYDAAEEDKNGSRSLYGEKTRKKLNNLNATDGFMSIDRVRQELLGQGSNDVPIGTILADPSLMMLIDSRINYKIFVTDDNIYTREELYNHYMFLEMGVQPEAIFCQQEIGIFPPRKFALREDELEYQTRDVGDESVDFIMLEDLVGQETRKNYVHSRKAFKIATTKVFVGKELWQDFLHTESLYRGMTRITAARLAAGNDSQVPLLSMLTGGAGTGASSTGPKLLTDQATLDAQREAFAKEMAERDAQMRVREEEQRRVQEKIDADLARLEDMLRRTSAAVRNAAAEPPVAAEPPAVDGDDSVAI